MPDIKDKILNIFKQSSEPMKAGEVAKKGNLDSKEVSKEITKLKNEGLLESPKRCYYQVKE